MSAGELTGASVDDIGSVGFADSIGDSTAVGSGSCVSGFFGISVAVAFCGGGGADQIQPIHEEDPEAAASAEPTVFDESPGLSVLALSAASSGTVGAVEGAGV